MNDTQETTEVPSPMAQNAHSGAEVSSAQAPSEPAKTKPVKKGESWLEIVKTIVYALLIAGVIRSFLFQPFNIPSGSMEGTLLIGDYLFISKAAYGYSEYSLPFSLIPFKGRILPRQPARGDVVVFKFPGDNSTDYIKRLIGVPGDHIQMMDGTLYLNGKAIPKVKVDNFVGTNPCPAGVPITMLANGMVSVPRFRETLPGGVSYDVLDCDPNGYLDDTREFVVPAGHYFMMGDNRDNSADSRADVGYVAFDNLEGKAEIIFFSTDDSARIWEVWKWPFAIRYGRIGSLVY